jgi:hypothetical protein
VILHACSSLLFSLDGVFSIIFPAYILVDYSPFLALENRRGF